MATTDPQTIAEIAELTQVLQNLQNAELSLHQCIRAKKSRYKTTVSTLLRCTPEALRNDVLLDLLHRSEARHEEDVVRMQTQLRNCRENIEATSMRLRQLGVEVQDSYDAE